MEVIFRWLISRSQIDPQWDSDAGAAGWSRLVWFAGSGPCGLTGAPTGVRALDDGIVGHSVDSPIGSAQGHEIVAVSSSSRFNFA